MTARSIAAAAGLTLMLLTAPVANAEPRCMNYLWYSACHDTVTDKWQVCNFYNDQQCYDNPAPLAPSPFDPIR
jgi:hypothetical protein